MSYLAQWYDHSMVISEDDTAESIERAEVQRLAKLLAIAAQVQATPRRLGSDATPEELALDKRRAKRISHVAGQLLTGWGGTSNSTGDISREAAQVEWRRWWNEHQVWLINRQRYIATWAQKTGADQKWARSALVKLNNELQWLAYALRD